MGCKSFLGGSVFGLFCLLNTDHFRNHMVSTPL